ncbi:MAG TPA: hypothetical protein VIL12_01640 [Acidimicrobiia bacterium]
MSLAASDDRNRPRGSLSAVEPLFTIEPFVGWRRWIVAPGGRDHEPVLASTIVGHRWESAQMRAFCVPGDRDGILADPHRAPDPRCSCGIYAFKGPVGELWTGVGVWAEGTVMLWGRVLETRLGYRAEQARMIPPLSVRIRCEPEPGALGWDGILCRRRPTTVVVTRRSYAPLCEFHRRRVEGEIALTPQGFGSAVREALSHRYGVEVYWRGATRWT